MLHFASILEDLNEHIRNMVKKFNVRFWTTASGCMRIFEGLIMLWPYAWTFLRREKSFAPAGIQAPDRPARSLVAVPTELTPDLVNDDMTSLI
jgi:hypothetical protein